MRLGDADVTPLDTAQMGIGPKRGGVLGYQKLVDMLILARVAMRSTLSAI